MDDFLERLNQADKKEHPVETEWHYPVMTAHGYRPLDLIGIGFVRAYRYQNEQGHIITCRTGVNADYWVDQSGKQGYWGDLKKHLETL